MLASESIAITEVENDKKSFCYIFETAHIEVTSSDLRISREILVRRSTVDRQSSNALCPKSPQHYRSSSWYNHVQAHRMGCAIHRGIMLSPPVIKYPSWRTENLPHSYRLQT
jgi:hypothetical protein